MLKGRKMKGIFLLGLLVFLLAGCGADNPHEETTANLKLGVLSLEDILPMIVAKEKGYFVQGNLSVELIPFQSALESQSAIQSGQIDGMMTDLIVAALLREGGTELKVTSITLEATEDRRRFAIVVPPGSSITSIADLKGKELGISFNSIIEFTSDELLKNEGFAPEDIIKTAIPKIPVRLEMLLNNHIDAVNLPDPLISFAEFNGCKVIADDRNQGISQAVLVMTDKTLAEKEEALKNFYQAYGKAVQEINYNPGEFKNLMAEHISIPEPILDQYQIPVFPEPKVPTEDELARVMDWLVGKELLSQAINYGDFVVDWLY